MHQNGALFNLLFNQLIFDLAPSKEPAKKINLPEAFKKFLDMIKRIHHTKLGHFIPHATSLTGSQVN